LYEWVEYNKVINSIYIWELDSEKKKELLILLKVVIGIVVNIMNSIFLGLMIGKE